MKNRIKRSKRKALLKEKQAIRFVQAANGWLDAIHSMHGIDITFYYSYD